jgi:CBS domain-containing membrane protein
MGAARQAGVEHGWPKQHGAPIAAGWSAVTTAVLVAIPVAFAVALKSAFLFVSIGPIIYEYVERPMARASSPRSTILANTFALLIGYASLAVFRLLDDPSAVQEGARAGAVICAVGVTGGLLVLLRAVHPPAGSTLLLVTLGIMHRPLQLLCILATIVIVTVVAWALNRLAGIPVPVWSSAQPSAYDTKS